jgi:hypothetical protein
MADGYEKWVQRSAFLRQIASKTADFHDSQMDPIILDQIRVIL